MAVGALVLAAGLLGSPTVDAQTTPTSQTSQFVGATVRVEPGVDVDRVAASLGGWVVAHYPELDAHLLSVPGGRFNELALLPGVVEVTRDIGPNENAVTEPAEPDTGREPVGFVDSDHGHDEGGSSYPALDLAALARVIDADKAWRRTRGAGIDVALVDTGVAPVEGIGPVINGPDLSFDGPNPAMTHHDGYGHGTHLAGIVNGDTAAAPGLAPASRVVNVRVGAADGAVDVSQVIAAIDWVVQHRNSNGLNMRVLVLAYGTDSVQPYEIDPLAAAVENAWRNGVVVVAAGGNRGPSALSLDNPAIDPYVIAVGASETNGTFTSSDDTIAPFNSAPSATRGVDLVAPGRSVVSLRVPNSFVDVAHPEGRVGTQQFRGSGSSQAAAVVGAAAALVLADRPGLTPDQVKWLLTDTARLLNDADPAMQGAGVLDVDSAVRKPLPNAGVSQTWPQATGSGSLEAARGTYHVAAPDGTVLSGEQTVWAGGSWSGTSWSGTSWSGTSWSGGSWSGTSWSGTSWSGGSWSGGSWSGTSWSGGSWSGGTWLGTSWSGGSWSGGSWSGGSWSGGSWSGQSWSGQSWSGGSWSGTSWSGTSWSGGSWSGTSWSGGSWSGGSWSGTSWSGGSWSGGAGPNTVI
jgi:serine protease AprX